VSRLESLAAGVQPYDPLVARRAAAGVLAAFAVIDFVGTVTAGLSRTLTIVVGYVFPVFLLLWAVVVLRVDRRWVQRCLIVNPLLATALICVIVLATRDTTASGQLAFCAPVLYAASQLRVTGALIVLVSTMGANLVTALLLLPIDQALTNAANVSVILVMITVVLASAGTRQERLLRRLGELAALDPLTGLVTRRVFDEAAQTALLRAGGRGTALVLVDVDNFKTVNDTYGHPVGDDALTHLANVLRTEVDPGNILCRLGGDEVAVLAPGADCASAQALAERFLTAVRASPLRRPGRNLALTISCGVGCVSGPGAELRELYAAADASLYDAKRRGRDRVGSPVDAALPESATSATPVPIPRPATDRDRAGDVASGSL
jgi:diguanylate cyclase (GGDEF)-like protein